MSDVHTASQDTKASFSQAAPIEPLPENPASPDALALPQGLGRAGDLVLNGPMSANGVAILDPRRRVTITSVGDDMGINWTVAGANKAGNPLSDTFAGADAGTVRSSVDFSTVVRISSTGRTADMVTVGVGAVEPAAEPLDEDLIVHVATAMARAHQGPNAEVDPNGYLDPARTFVAAALAMETYERKRRELPPEKTGKRQLRHGGEPIGGLVPPPPNPTGQTAGFTGSFNPESASKSA
jgi:hypothetical protein